jgi:hypothetical protein
LATEASTPFPQGDWWGQSADVNAGNVAIDDNAVNGDESPAPFGVRSVRLFTPAGQLFDDLVTDGYRCQLTGAPQDQSLAPDGHGIVWSEGGTIQIASIGDLSQGDCASINQHTLAATGSEPMWGPAAVNGTAPPPSFNSLTPARILDTRPGELDSDGVNSALAPGADICVPVLGLGNVPASGVGAVAINVTVTGPTQAGYLTVYPGGATRPGASNLNFAAGQTVPNLVIAKIGSCTGGQVRIYNPFGSTDVIFDVAGWFPTA